MSVVGFDFGNQTCYIAVARQGGIETIANEYSDRQTPSCVSFGECRRYMGASAKQQQIANFKNTISGWKPLVGRKKDDKRVIYEQQFLPYDIVSDENGNTAIKVRYLNESQIFTPEQITAMMLTKLKQTANHVLQVKISDCVISIPCFATDVERRAMLAAAKVAGLNCLKLMNDTTATALTYGIYKQDLPAIDVKSKHIIFVDMGYSSFQVSACAFNKGKLQVLGTAFDAKLGGRDFDMKIANHFAKEFAVKYGKNVDATKNPKAMTRLLGESEKLKKRMSSYAGAMPLSIECFMNDVDVAGKLSRDDMISSAKDLLVRAEATMKQILVNAKLSKADIDGVEIVGGSTRIPAIKELVEKVFCKEPSTTLNADESVVRGCALQCAIMSPTFLVRDFIITECQPYAISIHWNDPLQNDTSSDLFEQFHSIPFAKLLSFYRRDTFALTAKYSNPSQVPHDQKEIGTFCIGDIRPSISGECSKIKVKLRINHNGLFGIASATLIEKIATVEDTKSEGESLDQAKDSSNGEPSDSQMEWETAKAAEGDAKEAVDNEEVKTEEPPVTKQTNGKEDKKEDKKKKKPTSKQIDLSITTEQASLSIKDLDNLFEKECQMVSQDKLESERLNAKNTVEEYVYDIRDKINSIYGKFITDSDKESFQKQLNDTENWLYEEGEDEKKQVYLDKYNELKNLGNPVHERFVEQESRLPAMEELGKHLQLVRKSVERYDNKDEQLDHLEPEEVDKVRKCIEEKATYYEDTIKTFSALANTETATIKVHHIKAQTQALTKLCSPIMSKTKPKPKVVTPPETETPPPVPTETESNASNASEENRKPTVETDGDMDLD